MNKIKSKKIIIIGAGLSGLSAAAKLASKGFDVTVLEKNDQPGGRAMILEENGFKFDMGPSWFMMPDIYEKYFEELGKNFNDYVKLERLDPSYRVYFEDNQVIDISADLNKNLQTFESIEKGSANKLKKYLEDASFKYKIGMDNFIYRIYNSIFDLVDWNLINKTPKLDFLINFDKFVRKFFKNEHLIKILEFMVVFIGGSPKNVPALYSLLAHTDFNLGIWYPEGGINGVIIAFEKLCKEYGVKFEYNTEVNGIYIDEETNTKVIHTNKETFETQLVLNSADYHHVEMDLLPPRYQSYSEKYWDSKVLSPSALLFYLGINKKLDKMVHHTLFFNNSWDSHFDSIFKSHSWPKDFLYYTCTPSKTDKTVAPEGMENLVILVPLAAGLKDDPEIHEKMFEKIILDMEEKIGQKFKENIVVKKSFCLSDFKSVFNAYKGNAFGLAHTIFQTTVFRPSYKSKKIPGFYYTGQFTTPGVGLPIALVSGQIISDVIIKNHGQ